MKTWIKNPLAVWTGTTSDATNGLVIDGDKIAEIVAVGCEPTEKTDREFDASGLVIIPGLINCHHHFYQTLTRAFPGALNKELFSWLVSLYPVWAGLAEESIALSTELALAELMLSGCSTASDHHYLFTEQIPDAIDIQVEAVRKMGARAVLTRGSMSLSEKDGGLPPDRVVQGEDVILAESERLIETYHDSAAGSYIQIALAPCSPFSVTPELMRESAVLARKHGVLLHTHLGETEDENDYCVEKFGLRPLDLLDEFGWLADDVWLAHGVRFNDAEVARLGKAGTGISHCPSSNMLLASGVCRAKELEDAGAAGISHEDALRWGTVGGAQVWHRPDLGTLETGKAADMATFDLDELRFSGSGDPVAALVLCGAHKVRHLMIGGELRVSDGELVEVDVPRLRARHQELANQLAERA